MIEIKELRIGNKLKIDGIIVSIDERTLFDFSHDKRVKEPIPLTAEFLKNHTKLERFSGWDDMIFWAIPEEKDNNNRFELLEVEGGFELPSGYNCKSVHLLQNTYFFHYCDGREADINI